MTWGLDHWKFRTKTNYHNLVQPKIGVVSSPTRSVSGPQTLKVTWMNLDSRLDTYTRSSFSIVDFLRGFSVAAKWVYLRKTYMCIQDYASNWNELKWYIMIHNIHTYTFIIWSDLPDAIPIFWCEHACTQLNYPCKPLNPFNFNSRHHRSTSCTSNGAGCGFAQPVLLAVITKGIGRMGYLMSWHLDEL